MSEILPPHNEHDETTIDKAFNDNIEIQMRDAAKHLLFQQKADTVDTDKPLPPKKDHSKRNRFVATGLGFAIAGGATVGGVNLVMDAIDKRAAYNHEVNEDAFNEQQEAEKRIQEEGVITLNVPSLSSEDKTN